MENKYCENCGSVHHLFIYEDLKPPNKDICLCEDCADMPIKSIQRQDFSNSKIFIRDLEKSA